LMASASVLAGCSAELPVAAPAQDAPLAMSGTIGSGPPPGTGPVPMDQVMEAALTDYVAATGLDPRATPNPSQLPDQDSFVRRSFDEAAVIAPVANAPAAPAR